MLRVFIGGFVGAIVAFLWSFVSWTVLPWHENTMNQFTNQDFVSFVVKENAPKSGVYFAPSYKTSGATLTPDEIEKNMTAQTESMKKGPIIFAQVRLEGINYDQPTLMIYSFLTQFVGATLICFLIRRTAQIGYGGRLLFVTLIGLIVGILGLVPGWTWFGAGWKYTLVMIADLTATWFLVGLVISSFIKGREKSDKELLM